MHFTSPPKLWIQYRYYSTSLNIDAYIYSNLNCKRPLVSIENFGVLELVACVDIDKTNLMTLSPTLYIQPIAFHMINDKKKFQVLSQTLTYFGGKISLSFESFGGSLVNVHHNELFKFLRCRNSFKW